MNVAGTSARKTAALHNIVDRNKRDVTYDLGILLAPL